MKKTLTVIITLLVLVAFASGVMAQGTTPAPAPAAPAPAPGLAPAKAKAEKPKSFKTTKAAGTVVAYEAKKTIKVKENKKESTFDITPDTTINGKVKEGVKVTLIYKQEGDKIVATLISVVEKKAKKGKK